MAGRLRGVMAAVAAARLGHTVSLVDIHAHTGGVARGALASSPAKCAARAAPF